MGVEKPYEVETGALRAPPRPGERVPIEERLRLLIRASSDRVVIAGLALEPTRADADRAARELRALLTHRFEERRPNADAHTWERFVAIVRGVVRGRRYLDYDLTYELIEAIDGL